MFDWMFKPYIEWTFIDDLICFIDVFIIFIVAIIIYATIVTIHDTLKERRKK